MITKRATTADALPLDLADWLLRVVRTPGEIEQLRAAGVPYNSWLHQFTASAPTRAEFLALWARHRKALAAEAKRRGIELPDPANYPESEHDPWPPFVTEEP